MRTTMNTIKNITFLILSTLFIASCGSDSLSEEATTLKSLSYVESNFETDTEVSINITEDLLSYKLEGTYDDIEVNDQELATDQLAKLSETIIDADLVIERTDISCETLIQETLEFEMNDGTEYLEKTCYTFSGDKESVLGVLEEITGLDL